jgi:hypothetical protein
MGRLSPNNQEVFMTDYVKKYQALDQSASRKESQADDDRWEQCRTAAEAVDAEFSARSFGAAVGKSEREIRRQVSLWRSHGAAPAAARPTYRDAYAELQGRPTGSERTTQMATEGVRNLPPDELEKVVSSLPPAVLARQAARPDVARAIVRNDDTREAVEEAAIDHRARFADSERDERMAAAPRQSAAGMARNLGTDLATSSLRQAAGLIAEAVFEREEFGIEHPDDERDAIDRVARAFAAYQAGTVSDDERGWLESIGVQA